MISAAVSQAGDSWLTSNFTLLYLEVGLYLSAVDKEVLS